MTKSTITRERVVALIAEHSYDSALVDALEHLLAAMDSEPVAWLAIYHGEVYDDAIGITRSVVEAQADRFGWESALTEIIPLYRHAQPAPERDRVRREHAEWSQTTFGNVGPVGPLKHLSKEALEAAAEPDDLSEWADMQFLLWDAQRRAGITDEQITQAMIEKLAVNKLRDWPEPKDGEPRLHIKEQPAPVAQKEPISFDEWSRKCALQITLCYPDFREKAQYIWDSARETQQPAPVVPEDVLDALQKVARIRLDLNDFDGDYRGIADCLSDAEEALIEVVNRRAAMLNGGKP